MKKLKTLLLACVILLLLNFVLPTPSKPSPTPGDGFTINNDLPPIDTY